MQAGDSRKPPSPADSGAGEGCVRPILPEKQPLRTIVVVGPGRLLVTTQEAIENEGLVDADGFLEFAMASRDGTLTITFKILPNEWWGADEVLELARQAGNDFLLRAYAEVIRENHGKGKRGEV